MRIYILDDCEILRTSLSLVFQDEKEIKVVGESGSDGDVCREIMQSRCDTLLIGLRQRNSSGLEITQRLRSCGSNVCVIAFGYPADENVPDMYKAGVDSFISMSSSNAELIRSALSARRNLYLRDFPKIATKVS